MQIHNYYSLFQHHGVCIDRHFGDIINTKRCVDDFLIYGKPDDDKIGTADEYTSAVRNHNAALKEVLERVRLSI